MAESSRVVVMEKNTNNTVPISSNLLRVKRAREEYMDSVERMMYPQQVKTSYGYCPSEKAIPLFRITGLGYLQSPLRKVTVMEKWSPLEIALFESSICLYGKEFHKIQKQVKSKSVKEIIEFYYDWKKTKHYRLWKKTYIPDDRDTPIIVADE